MSKQFWCEIDLNKLQYNLNIIRRNTDKKIIAVVKGNAYGLGINRISNFLSDKVDCFAVSSIEEANQISSDKDILILTPVINLKDLKNSKENIIFTVDSESILYKMDKKKQYKIHIYVDTGMNRFGVKPNNLNKLLDKIYSEFPNVIIDGIYTHLHNTDDTSYTLKQINLFRSLVLPYKNQIKNIHYLNSSGFLNYHIDTDFDNAIRVGNILYGYAGNELGYKDIFTYYAKPIRIYTVEKGEFIGYGNTYKTKKKTRVGILELGYIHHFGFRKNIKSSLFYNILRTIRNHFKKTAEIFYDGKSIKVLGKPTMNYVLIDIEDLDEKSIFKVNISPILADSTIPKEYKSVQLGYANL